MRALVFALFALVAGCGSNDTTTPIPADMSVRADLAGSPASCGVDGVMLSCSGVSGGAACYICSFANGAGSCAKPCTLLSPTCPTGQTCH
ncbi:MAG TPA: hypothetical protein VF997_20885, partial [Polyangia bacterium]